MQVAGSFMVSECLVNPGAIKQALFDSQAVRGNLIQLQLEGMFFML